MLLNISIYIHDCERVMKDKINKILEILYMIWKLLGEWIWIILPIIIIIELIFVLIAGFISYSNL